MLTLPSHTLFAQCPNPPVVNAGVSKSLICSGSSDSVSAYIVSGTGTGPVSFSWAPTAYLSCSDCQNPIATPNNTITYTVTVTDSIGCSGNNYVTLNIDQVNPTINIVSFNSCGGSTAILQGLVQQGGNSPYTYLWLPNNGTAQYDTLTMPAGAQGLPVNLLITDSLGCNGSNHTNLITDYFNVYLPPTFKTCAMGGGTASGQGNGLYPQISGGVQSPVHPFQYSWSNGSNQSYLSFAGLSSGVYSVTVTDANGCTATASDTLTLFPAPTIHIAASDTVVLTDEQDTLTATGGVNYFWNTGQTGNHIIVGSPKYPTVYTVYGFDSNGCMATAFITISPTGNFVLSPDTSRQYRTAHYPSIFYGGNVSIGADTNKALQTPHHTLDVHGGISADSVITNSLTANKITIRDTMQIAEVKTHRIGLFPGDSVIRLGDSSFYMDPTHYDIYSAVISFFPHYEGISLGYHNFITGSSTGGTIGAAVGGFNNITGSYYSLALGFNNNISAANYSTVLGNNLTNNITGSIMMGGYNSSGNIPAISIIPDIVNSSPGFVGIGTASPSILSAFDAEISGNNGNIVWGKNGASSMLDADGGGSIELGAWGNGNITSTSNPISAGKPYIDFHYGNGTAQDYNVRIINDINNELDVVTANDGVVFSVIGTPNANSNPYVRAPEVKVCVTGCDFVFEKNYVLMSLDELENYLQLNHHLPGIPSAKEMEGPDGVALGKLNMELLRKIEELTLYTIELKKEINQLSAVVNGLKK